MRRSFHIPVGFLGSFLALGAIHAHESFLDCYDNRDGTITCQAGYSDGDLPADTDRILVKDRGGKTLLSGSFDEAGTFSFERPEQGGFIVIFVGSQIGHTNRVDASGLLVRAR